MLPPTIILAGGRGTRAQAYLGDVPKFLAPVGAATVAGRLLPWLRSFNPRSISLLLTAGYGDEQILARLSQNLVDFTYVDWAPQGSLTALRRAARFLTPCPEGILLLNGDTLLDADLLEAYRAHRKQSAFVTELVTFKPEAVSSGCRLLSSGAWRLLLRSSQANVEDALPLLCSRMVYPARAWVDVGTRAGWEAAQSWIT